MAGRNHGGPQGAGTRLLWARRERSNLAGSSSACVRSCAREALQSQLGIQCSVGRAMVCSVPWSDLVSRRKALGIAYEEGGIAS